MTETRSEKAKVGSEEVAAYIAGLTAEMVRLARSHNLSDLTHLLQMARMEALQRATSGPDSDSKRIA
jgi:hypothetical protein